MDSNDELLRIVSEVVGQLVEDHYSPEFRVLVDNTSRKVNDRLPFDNIRRFRDLYYNKVFAWFGEVPSPIAGAFYKAVNETLTLEEKVELLCVVDYLNQRDFMQRTATTISKNLATTEGKDKHARQH